MRRTQRLAAIGAMLSLTALVGACGGTGTGDPAADGAAPPAPPAVTSPPAAPDAGTTQVGDIYGPACDQVPTTGPGSPAAMAGTPVAAAAAANPLLSRLVEAAQAAGLIETLNDPNARYTIFAPANVAFESLPPGTIEALLADPRGELTRVLGYHVVPRRYDAEGLARAGTVQTVAGIPLAITGEPGSLVIDQQERARVLCGNIPTANATVFVIDKVLMPAPA